METIERTLTAEQAKMVIEYFSQQAAEDLPADEDVYAADEHMWKTRYTTSLAIGRRIGDWWWTALVEAERNLQSFDRDPKGFLNEHDIDATYEDTRDHLERQVSWSIDNVWNNSGS